MIYIISVAMAWSVESQPSDPATRVRFLAGSGILVSILGLVVCPLSVLFFCCLWRWPWHSDVHWFQRGLLLCICLAFWSKVCAPPTGIWPMDQSRMVVGPTLGESKKQMKKESNLTTLTALWLMKSPHRHCQLISDIIFLCLFKLFALIIPVFVFLVIC